MNATRSQLKTQYDRAKRLGWIPFFQEASNTITKGFFDAADLMGIGSRESNLDPKWLTKAGDHGNGFGLMQADKRSFPQFTKGDAWKDAKTGILFGAKVLMQKWHDVQSGVGLKRGVTSSKTKKISYYIGKDVGQGAEAQAVAIASYNAGRWPAYAVANGKHPDTYTTGKDYSADVIARAKVFRELLAQDFPSSAANQPDPSAITQDTAHNLASATSVAEVIAPAVPVPVPAIEVPQVVASSEPPPEPPKEDTLTKVGNKFNALWTLAGTSIIAAGTWLTSTPIGIAVAIIGAAALIGIVYMIITTYRATKKENREAAAKEIRDKTELELKLMREKNAHEIQMAMISSAADPKQNTVVIGPPPATQVETPQETTQ